MKLQFSTKAQPREVKMGERTYKDGDIARTFERLDELLDCTSLSDWECEFVDSVDRQRREKPDHGMTPKQLNKINDIWEDHFETH